MLLRRLSSDYAVVLFATWYIECFPIHTHHLLYGVLTQYLSPGPCLDVVDFWPSSKPVVADAIARVPFALFA
jgi:hypothetical protein